MKYKLYLIDMQPEAYPILAKQSNIEGRYYGKYCLTIIDDNYKLQTKAFTGAIKDVLAAIFSYYSFTKLPLGNFMLDFESNGHKTGKLDYAEIGTTLNSSNITIYGDTINKLSKLQTSSAVAIANVIGKKNNKEVVEYGTVLCYKNGNCEMMPWSKIKLGLRGNKIAIHNIILDSDNNIIKTNISSLDKVYLVVPGIPVKPADKPEEKQPQKPKTAQQKTKVEKEREERRKFILDLVDSGSPLAYGISDEYSLDCLEYLKGLSDIGEDVTLMLNPKFNLDQLTALYYGICNDVDISLIADPKISAHSMRDFVLYCKDGFASCLRMSFTLH